MRSRLQQTSCKILLGVLLGLVGPWGILSSNASAQTYLFNRADFTTGTGPAAVAVGDFNGDGKPDLAVVNATGNSISILLGKPDGTFQAHVEYAVGSGPSAVVAGDFNRDGKLDLAVTNKGDSTVSILLGKGDGTFQSQVTYATGSQPTSVVAGDFNADGAPDLAVANSNDSTVSILLGNGDGTFQTQTAIATGSPVLALTTGDLNGDGKVDLATNHAVLLGNGDGTFQGAAQFDPGISSPSVVTAGDFNGDGKLDLAVANNTASFFVSVLLGKGDGTFGTAVQYALPGAAGSLLVVDLNGDGKLDLVVGDSACIAPTLPSGCVTIGGFSVFLGKGDGTFQANVDYSAGSAPPAVFAGDFNGDGKLDLAVANGGSNLVSVLLGKGDGTFPTHTDLPVSGLPSSIVAGDFRVDGKLDLADANQNDAVSVLLGNGDGTFAPSVDYPTAGSDPTSVVTGDFNGDGYPDLAVANASPGTPGSANVAILLGKADGTGTFQPAMNYPAGGNWVASGDFNGDNNIDLATQAGILLGKGDGTFQSLSGPALGGVAGVTGDFNGDGKVDLAVVDTQNLLVYLGKGDGTFQSAVTYPTGTLPQYVTAADLNGDGKLDLATANGTANTVSVLLGNGDGTFQGHVDYATGAAPFSVTIGDFNGDGKPDLATANQLADTVSVLLGRGDGTFQSHIDLPAGAIPTGITTGDFDGDGGLDLATANSGGTVSLLLSARVVALFPSALTFVSQSVGTTSSPQTVTISNPGSVPVKILSIQTTGPFAPAPACALPATLSPGTNCTINVTFTPTAAGMVSGILTVTDDAMGSPQAITLSGNVPVVSLSTGAVSFPGQAVGSTSAAQPVTVTNTGGGPLTFSGITASGDFAETNTCPATPATLAAGANCAINITFAPTQAGTRIGSITIADNANGSPQSVALVGSGIDAPLVTLSPASLSFAAQPVGTTGGAQAITLTNTGQAALTITSIAASPNFVQTSNCPGSLAAGTSCTVSVAFAPTSAGTLTGTLTVTDNAPGSPHTVSISGTGADFSFSATPATTTPTVAGQSATYTLTLSPVGGFNQTVNVSCSGVPAQAACSVSPASLMLNGTSAATATVTVTTSVNMPGGTYTLTLNGASSVTHSASVTLQVMNFALSISPASTTVTAGQTATATLSVSAQGGFNQSLALSCGSPAGVTCSVSPASLTLNGSAATATVTAATTADVAAGPNTLVVTAAGSVTHNASIILQAENFSLSASPTSTTITAGQSATATLTITPQDGFNQSVTLSCGSPAQVSCSVSAPSIMLNGTSTTATVTATTTAGTPGGAYTVVATAAAGPTEHNVSVALEVANFSLSVGGTPQTPPTVTPGGTATYNLTVSPAGGFNQRISFTCSGAPSESACTVSPASVTPNGSAAKVTVTVSTTAPSGAGPGRHRIPPQSGWQHGPWLVLAALLALLSAAYLRLRRPIGMKACFATGPGGPTELSPGREKLGKNSCWAMRPTTKRSLANRWRSRARKLAFGVTVLAVLLWAACGGSNSTTGGGNPGTPLGDYTLTVTGTSGTGSTALTQTVKLALSVKAPVD